MLRLKSCPRCRVGDLHVNKDMFGWYFECLQCGHMKYIDNPDSVDEHISRPTRNAKAVSV